MHSLAFLLLFLYVWLCRLADEWPARHRVHRPFRRHPTPVALSPGNAPRAVAGKKPAWATTALIRLAARTPKALASCRRLSGRFNRRFASRGVTVSHDWVWKQLKQHAPAIARQRRRWRACGPRPLPVNDTWAADLTGLTDATGETHLVFGLLDHGSRALLSLRCLRRKTSITILRALLDACERHGIPRALRTDNEAMFTSALFRFALRWLGIRHQRSAPGCPWQNGRIERFFGTLKRELEILVPPSLGTLPARLSLFASYYNARRPHMALNDRTPAQAWQAGGGTRHRADSG
ncbi:integrase core domain-containing protein [Marilutibacter alkalisoli]|uniref:integrase core domain-containing protein n=1 Tax=Marilutibacter alkalisoli TaxID=2591633 RepID=UPI0014241EE5|nr:integrase core domain-containing protein [Lysobacter alkalisoli]